MKIQCLNKNLKSAVSVAERNTSKNQTLPILNSIFIGAEKDTIKIRATNLETAVEISVSGKIHNAGSVVVPAKTINSFLNNIPEEQIILQVQKNNLFIKTDSMETIIRGYPPEDFPIFPKVDIAESISMSSPELRFSLASVVTAASISYIKPELASVCFNIFKNSVKIAATDSFRLAEKNIVSKETRLEKMTSYLVPQRSVQEMLRLLENDENVKLGANKNQIIILGGDYKFISRLTDGKFPDYEQIIPKSFKTIAVARKNDVLSNIKLASVFAGKLNDITLFFSPSKKAILMSTAHSEVGEHSASVSASVQGEEVTAKFNWRYLADGIPQINSEYIEFNLNGDQSPMLIKGKGDNSYVYLVMPMRGI